MSEDLGCCSTNGRCFASLIFLNATQGLGIGLPGTCISDISASHLQDFQGNPVPKVSCQSASEQLSANLQHVKVPQCKGMMMRRMQMLFLSPGNLLLSIEVITITFQELSPTEYPLCWNLSKVLKTSQCFCRSFHSNQRELGMGFPMFTDNWRHVFSHNLMTWCVCSLQVPGHLRTIAWLWWHLSLTNKDSQHNKWDASRNHQSDVTADT